jgi:hypothetical protein
MYSRNVNWLLPFSSRERHIFPISRRVSLTSNIKENQSQMKCIKLLIPTKLESNEETLKMELISIIPEIFIL